MAETDTIYMYDGVCIMLFICIEDNPSFPFPVRYSGCPQLAASFLSVILQHSSSTVLEFIMKVMRETGTRVLVTIGIFLLKRSLGGPFEEPQTLGHWGREEHPPHS